MSSIVSTVLGCCKARFGSAGAVKGDHRSAQSQPEEVKGFTVSALLLVFFRKRLEENWGSVRQAGVPYLLVQRTLDRLAWWRLTKRVTDAGLTFKTGVFQKGEVLRAALMELRQLEKPNVIPPGGEFVTVHRN